MSQILRMPVFWWVVVSGIFFTFDMYAIGTFMPAFLARIHHLPLTKVGIALGICQIAGGFGGALLAGRWGDRMPGEGDRRMRLAAIIILTGAPASYLAYRLPAGNVLVVLALFLYAYGSLNGYYGLVFSAMHEFVPPRLRATAMATYFTLLYLCGASLGPLLTGHLSDRFAHDIARAAGSEVITEAFRAAGLQEAMLIIPILAVATTIALWVGSYTFAPRARGQFS